MVGLLQIIEKPVCQEDIVLGVITFTSRELSKLINLYSPGRHQKTIGFLMISGGVEVNFFTSIPLNVRSEIW